VDQSSEFFFDLDSSATNASLASFALFETVSFVESDSFLFAITGMYLVPLVSSFNGIVPFVPGTGFSSSLSALPVSGFY
jgi:hypothetical protein